MLPRFALLTLLFHCGSFQYHPCLNVQTYGTVLDLKIGDCDAKITTCQITNTTYDPFVFTFVSNVVAQQLSANITVFENGTATSAYFYDNNPCDTVKCPVQAGQIKKWTAEDGAKNLVNGLIKVRTIMKDEKNRLIFCVINSVLINM